MIVANPAEPVTGAVPERGVPEPAITEAYRMRAGATVDSRADGTLVLRHGRSALLLDRPGAGRRAVLLRLAEGWLDDAEVVRVVTAADPERRILPVQILLRRLAVHSWLERRLRCGGQPLLDIRPRDPGQGARPPVVPYQTGARYRLTRVATARVHDGGVLGLHSPLSTVDVLLPDPRLAALLPLAAAGGVDLPAVLRAVGLTATAATRVLAELVDAGLLVAPTESAPPRAIRLPVPDLARRAGTEPSLTDVVAARRSIREHDDAVPIDRAALGEFLYRVQRAWDVREPGGPEPEVYPLVTRCAGVDPGLYRYDSIGHELVPLAAPGPLADRLLDSARDAASMVGRPQVLLVCTARVSRRMRQDGGPALAAARRDAGVLTELMYLVATAMGLAPCAVGPADPATFAELSGTDSLPEPGTARFLLGSRRPPV